MPQIDSIRLAARARPFARPFAHRARLTIHSPTHRACIHYITRRRAALPRRPQVRPPSLSWKRRKRRRRGESRYVGYFANSMSNRSHRSGRGSPFSSLLGSGPSGMAAIVSVRPAMGVQWHVPTTNSTPPSSFALFAECARARRTTVLFMCAAWGYCLSKVHRPRDAAKRLLK